MAVIFSPVLGPPLGGWLTDTYSWPWIFYINVPVGIVSVLLCLAFLDEPPLIVQERKQRWRDGIRFDYIGFILAALGLACLEVTLSKGETKDWFASPLIRTFATISGTALLLMVFWERRRSNPVMDIRLFRGHVFSTSFIVMFAVGMVLYSSTTYLPLLLQGSHGYTAYIAGLAMTPGGVATAIGMIAVGILTRSVQLRFLLIAGLITQIVPFFWMSHFAPDLTFSHAAWMRVWQAVGLGFLFIPISTLCYEGLPASKTNNATCLINVARNIGGSFGISMTSTVLATRQQYHHAVLAEHISSFNPQVVDALGAAQAQPDPVVLQQSLGVLDGLVNQQAVLMAFNDVFLFSAFVGIAVLFLVPLLPANDPASGELATH
jgi:DHA2 family multidrug resistance protein